MAGAGWLRDRGTDKGAADSVTDSGVVAIDELTTAAVLPETAPIGKRTAKALQDLERVRSQIARWQESAQFKQLRAQDLAARMGREILAAEDADDLDVEVVRQRLLTEAGQFRTDAEVDERTATAAAEKLPAAKRAVLQAEADDLRAELGEVRRDLDRHITKTTKLLDELRALDGIPYAPVRVPDDDVMVHGPRVLQVSKTSQLTTRFRELTTRVALLDIGAAGHALPSFCGQLQIPAHLYSPHLRGPSALFPELAVANDQSLHLELSGAPKEVVDQVRILTLFTS